MKYAERLNAFAEGRRFARTSQPVRTRADSWCDACGSIQARVLFGVQEQQTKEVYFVGEHCLQELAARGAIVRRFLRLSAEEAYKARCEARANSTLAVPASTQAMVPADPAGQTDVPESLLAYLILAAPGRRHAPMVLPLDEGAARRALDSLGETPGLSRQLRDLGLGMPPAGNAAAAAARPPYTELKGEDAGSAGSAVVHKTNASRRKPRVPSPEASPGAA
jgi:hypothetical protein